jgi:DNA-binding NtrC family response regulator
MLTDRLLQRQGYEVFSANGLREAKRIASKIDLVFSDLNLSDGTGWDVLSYFKSVNPATVVVAVSGNSVQTSTSADGIYAFDRVLTKPIDPKALTGLL